MLPFQAWSSGRVQPVPLIFVPRSEGGGGANFLRDNLVLNPDFNSSQVNHSKSRDHYEDATIAQPQLFSTPI